LLCRAQPKPVSSLRFTTGFIKLCIHFLLLHSKLHRCSHLKQDPFIIWQFCRSQESRQSWMDSGQVITKSNSKCALAGLWEKNL
jgi:hypothetical protein